MEQDICSCLRNRHVVILTEVIYDMPKTHTQVEKNMGIVYNLTNSRDQYRS
jgi:hypothetical protein